jgi:hypothetical protein
MWLESVADVLVIHVYVHCNFSVTQSGKFWVLAFDFLVPSILSFLDVYLLVLNLMLLQFDFFA